MKVNFKKLIPEATTPSYAKEGDAGLDMTATSKKIKDNLYIEYGTGIAVEIPVGYVGFLVPRSSVTDLHMMLKNSVGIIDSNYRGEVKFRFKGFNSFAAGGNLYYSDTYEVGDRVGQIVILPVPFIELIEQQELSESNRGDGGFGHTGK